MFHPCSMSPHIPSLFHIGMALGGNYYGHSPPSGNQFQGMDHVTSTGGGSYSPPHTLSPKGIVTSAGINGYNSVSQGLHILGGPQGSRAGGQLSIPYSLNISFPHALVDMKPGVFSRGKGTMCFSFSCRPLPTQGVATAHRIQWLRHLTEHSTPCLPTGLSSSGDTPTTQTWEILNWNEMEMQPPHNI